MEEMLGNSAVKVNLIRMNVFRSIAIALAKVNQNISNEV